MMNFWCPIKKGIHLDRKSRAFTPGLIIIGLLLFLLNLLIQHGLNLERQAEKIDESGGVPLVVNLVRTEGGQLLLVERVRRLPADRLHAALV